MKRSEINHLMRDAVEFTKELNFLLPPFAYWTIADWKTKGSEASEIVDNALGWDVTDFGLGDFHKTGLLMFTIRNGKFGDRSPRAKPYCEKLLIVEEGQVTPCHHHRSKIEDIINRGGGILQVEVVRSLADDGKAADQFEVSLDGVRRTVKPNTVIDIHSGESITLTQEHYHKFWGKPGHGKVLVGEVSSVNDDYVDNVFFEKVARFSAIEEDEPPLYLLYDDYKKYVSFK
ncbi:MAG: D-lyxose/D-mannose family sugar isomerase [Candidatus Lokiarchaeota archaeon]|nr:D-lyxose/D-mannose family sugar isomerase [Candidatus Lokiarchaeota archaeon]